MKTNFILRTFKDLFLVTLLSSMLALKYKCIKKGTHGGKLTIFVNVCQTLGSTKGNP